MKTKIQNPVIPYPPIKDVDDLERINAQDNPFWFRVIRFTVLATVIFSAYVIFIVLGAYYVGGK